MADKRRRISSATSSTIASPIMPRAIPAWFVVTHDRVSRLSEQPDGLETPREQPQSLDPVEVSDVLVQRAVPIEEDRRS